MWRAAFSRCSIFGGGYACRSGKSVPLDQFLIARTARRAVALVIDEAQGVIEPSVAALLKRGRNETRIDACHCAASRFTGG